MEYVPAMLSQQQAISINLERSVLQGREAAERVIEKFKKNNLARFIQYGVSAEMSLIKSLWMHHRMRAVSFNYAGVDFTIDLLNLCISGDLSTARFVMMNVTPDDMSQPYHFMSQDIIDELILLMTKEL